MDLRKRPALIRSWRRALRDELELDRKQNRLGPEGNDFRNLRSELSELYRELRTKFDHEGESDTARDFYFGELEADRLAHNWFQRQIGLSHLYKVLSGYSRREGLALSWLLAAIFVVFPLLFFNLVNLQEHWQFQTPFNHIAPAAYSDVAPDLLTRMPPHPCVLVASINSPEDSSPNRTPARIHSSSGPPSPPTQDAAAQAQSTFLLNQDRYFNILTRADDTVWGNGSNKSRALRAITASLQASTFFPSTTEDHSIDTAIQTMQSVRCPNGNIDQKSAAAGLSGLEYRRRLIAAIERLIVPAQLALFLLALRSRFQRSH